MDSDTPEIDYDDFPRRPDGNIKQVYESVELPNYVATERSHREVIQNWYATTDTPNHADWKRQRRDESFLRRVVLSYLVTCGEAFLAVAIFMLTRFLEGQQVTMLFWGIVAAFILFILTDLIYIAYFLQRSTYSRSPVRYIVVATWHGIPLLLNIALLVFWFQ